MGRTIFHDAADGLDLMEQKLGSAERALDSLDKRVAAIKPAQSPSLAPPFGFKNPDGSTNTAFNPDGSLAGSGGSGGGVGGGVGGAGRTGGYHQGIVLNADGTIYGAWVDGKAVPGFGVDKEGRPASSPRNCVAIFSLDGSTILWQVGEIGQRSSGAGGASDRGGSRTGRGAPQDSPRGSFPGTPAPFPPGTTPPPSTPSGSGGAGGNDGVIRATLSVRDELAAFRKVMERAITGAATDPGTNLRRLGLVP